MDISVLIPSINEGENLKTLIPLIKNNLNSLSVEFEIIIVEGGAFEETLNIINQLGAKVITQSSRGFGGALKDGFKAAAGDFVITMDADLSHDPKFIKSMWEKRFDAELIIASRYVEGGGANMGSFRKILSKILNKTFAYALSLKAGDLSSNFRMYRKRALDSIQVAGQNFDILEEILLKIYSKGWKIAEVPFYYQPRHYGHSHIKLLRFGKDYLRTLFKMWQLRNSIYCADYDLRAFYSKIFLQRYWQRKRHSIVLDFLDGKSSFLDVGCGSSKIIIDNPQAVALDLNIGKLRFLRSTNKKLINASAGNLPFKDSSFNCVVCSQVIEHTTDTNIIPEIHRVLSKDGVLVIGTPDYNKKTWVIIEKLYSIFHSGGYADEHIAHYTLRGLIEILEGAGFKILDYKYICNSELIIKACKI